MPFLPVNSLLGKLEMVEVFEYYDRPVLFACRNAVDTLYLVVLEDEDDESETWLYVAVSPIRFDHIRSGAIDLKKAFVDAENGVVFKVRSPFGKNVSEIDLVDATSLSDEDLPLAGEKLSLATPTLKILKSDIAQKAIQSQRGFVTIKLRFDNEKRTEAPAKILGHILSSTQDIINSFGQSLSELHKYSKNLTNDLTSLLELSVLDVGAGSFQIELASSQTEHQLSLFDDEDVFGDAMQALVSLMNTNTTNDELKTVLNDYRIEVAKGYLRLLQDVAHSRINETEISWASPKNRRVGSAKLSSLKVFAAIDVLKDLSESSERQYSMVGKLIGLYIEPPRRFRIQNLDDTEINGILSENISVEDYEFISHATLNERYRATIRETRKIKTVTGEETVKNELIRFESLEE